MGKFKNFIKSAFYFSSATLLAGLTLLILNPAAFAKPGGGNTTLCESGANRNTGSDKVGVGEKVKTGQRPLWISFSSNAQAGSVNFSSSSVEVDVLKAPRNGCSLDKIIVNLTSDCRIVESDANNNIHAIQVQFTCNDNGQNLYNLDVQADADAITPPNQTQNLYAAARQVMGLTDPSFNLAACDSVNDETEQKACASAICNMIKNQLMNGDTKALSTAGDIGQLIGSMQTTLDSCAVGSSLFQLQGPVVCDPDRVAANTALDLLLLAPQEHIQVDSDGAGSYLVTILADSSLFTPGDFVSIDMNTCTADFLQQ
jgi:hypothetical protein